MSIFILVSMSLLLLFSIEFVKRRFMISTEITRRCMHVGAAIINLVASVLVDYEAIILCNIGFATLLFFGKHTTVFSAIQKVKRHTYGDICFPLGIALAAAVLLPDQLTAFQYGVAVMGFADALAGFVGERWGKGMITIFGQKKTVTGSFVFFVVTIGITLVFIPISPVVVGLAMLLVGVELLAVFGLDNAVLPATAGILYSLLV